MFLWSTASLNLKFSYTSCCTKAKDPSLAYNSLIARLVEEMCLCLSQEY